MNNRVEYTVIKDFEDKLPFANTDVVYKYTVGRKVNLKPSGRLAQKWLEMGYIKESKQFEQIND